ncbi:MAG: hypothetical protein HOI47_29660 [Candidatus Scalindua sp.]|jgi:uncharacterized membrane protein YcgQ (UPF0703/DUF1980 family)|nr:hypothetical protein [Candidatus Scalindua sp.]
MNYIQNMIGCLTDGGVYGYKIQIRSGANNDSTTWINIDRKKLEKIKRILTDDKSHISE